MTMYAYFHLCYGVSVLITWPMLQSCIVLLVLVLWQSWLSLTACIWLQNFKHIMKHLQGAIIIGGAFQVILGYTGLMSLFLRCASISVNKYKTIFLSIQFNANKWLPWQWMNEKIAWMRCTRIENIKLDLKFHSECLIFQVFCHGQNHLSHGHTIETVHMAYSRAQMT